jgi:hypothetical protein
MKIEGSGVRNIFFSRSLATDQQESDLFCALLAIIAVGSALRLAFLFQPMRYDEAFSF